MQEKTYKLIELVGVSSSSIEEAVQNAVSQAAKSVRDMRWFEVIQTRGYIDGDKIAYWQAVIKVGFNVEGKEAPPSRAAADKKKERGTGKYRCTVCGYIYDPEKGDPDNGVKPGTRFEDLPDDWKCPECGVGKERFEGI